MISSAHRNYTGSLNVQNIASEFVSRNQKRRDVFGKSDASFIIFSSDCTTMLRCHPA